MGNIDSHEDRGDKIASLASRLGSEIKLWGAEKFDQALVQPASRAIENTAKAIKNTHESAVNSVVEVAEATRDKKGQLVDKAVRVAKGTTAVVQKVHSVAVDATSRYVVEPTADAGQALANSADKQYKGAIASTSRVIGNTVDTGKKAIKTVKDAHQETVTGIVQVAEATRDVKNKVVDKTVRFTKGAGAVAEYAGDRVAKAANKVHSVAVDATSRYVVEPTADAGKALANSADKQYKGAIASTSRVIGNTVDTGKQVVSTVQAKHEKVVAKVVATVEDVRDVKNGVVAVANKGLDIYDRAANPEKYQQVVDIKQKPKMKVADKSNKPVGEKKNAG